MFFGVLNRFFSFGGLWLILATLSLSTSSSYAVDLQPLITIDSPVVDNAGVLSATERQSLQETLGKFSAAEGSQIAIVTLLTTKPEEIEQYSIRLMEQEKLGRKEWNDGILIILATQDRKVRIEVGYGLEGAVSDFESNQIIQELLAPNFQKNQYFQGLSLATERLISLVQAEQLPPPAASQNQAPASRVNWLGIFFAAMFFLALLLDFLPFKYRLFAIGSVGAILGGGLAYNLAAPLLQSIAIGAIAGFLLGAIGMRRSLFYLFALFFLLSLFAGASRSRGFGSNGSFRSGGFGGGGSFGGGGGRFGGGGASGSW